MKIRSGIYKVYSIVGFVCGSLILLAAIFIEALISGALISGDIKDQGPVIGFQILFGILTLLWVLFEYIELTSMFASADIMRNINSDDKKAKRRSFCFSPKFYADFGLLIFSIILFISCISFIAMFIYAFVSEGAAVPAEIAICVVLILVNVITYYQYYLRYNSIGTSMEVTYNDDPDSEMEEDIHEISTRGLKGYSVFFLILSAALIFAAVVSVISIVYTLSVFNVIIGPLVFMYLLAVINMIIYYMYYRDIANMVTEVRDAI